MGGIRLAGPVALGGLTPAAIRPTGRMPIPRISHDERQVTASGGV
jgi:hypothetical protein